MTPPWSVRWAARYAFVDELWRGRARVIVDPALEALLRDGGPGVADGSDPVLRELVDDLLPVEPLEAEPVWMAVATADVAAELGPVRPGTTFVPLHAIADVVVRAHWDVALIDLQADFDPAAGSPTDQAENALDELGLDGGRGRVVVLSVPVRDYPRAQTGLEYAELSAVVAERLGGGRLFGLYVPPMAAVVEFGDAVDPDEVDDDAEDVQTVQIRPSVDTASDEDDEIPLTYDNTLGTQDPALLEFIAIAGVVPPVEGLALVELPPGADERAVDSGIAAQLSQARRQVDLAAIDRQAQLERAEGLERDNAELRRQLDARPAAPPPSVADEGVGFAAAEVALEAALAREQALKWRVSELEQAVHKAMSRPVEALEAEVAALRAQVADRPAEQGVPADRPAEATAPDATLAAAQQAGPGDGGAEAHTVVPAACPPQPHRRAAAPRPATASVVRALQALVRRIERGGMGTLELRRELVALRHRLQVDGSR